MCYIHGKYFTCRAGGKEILSLGYKYNITDLLDIDTRMLNNKPWMYQNKRNGRDVKKTPKL